MKTFLFSIALSAIILVKTYTGTCTDVHDGDSVTVDIETEFVHLGSEITIRTPTKVRLDGIDAYELNTAKGKEARDFLKGIILNKRVWVSTDNDKREKYGRLLAILHIGTTNLNELLVEKGFAKEYHGGPR